MSRTRASILIVDDNAMLRVTLEMIFSEAGYLVQLASDGFSALAQIRQETPDLLLSDLNMPGMSGFELLSVVRRRFPEIRAIAMSGSFSGSAVPPGVMADAFHEKSRTSVNALLRLVRAVAENPLPPAPKSSASVWISRTRLNPCDGLVTNTCPEPLRVFPQAVREGRSATEEVHSLHCSTAVEHAFVQPSPEAEVTGLASGLTVRQRYGERETSNSQQSRSLVSRISSGQAPPGFRHSVTPRNQESKKDGFGYGK